MRHSVPHRLTGTATTVTPNGLITAVGLILSLVVVGWVAGLFGTISNDRWTIVVTVVSLIAVVAVIADRLSRADGDPVLRWVLLGAFATKLLGTFLRYQILFVGAYDGSGDALHYHAVGEQLARSFSSGDFSLGDHALVGTRFIEVATGYLYWVLAPSRILGFLVFSFLGFLGLVFYTRAYRTAVPDGPVRLYDGLVLFLPSLFFWPSSIGKESWMTLTLGLIALGAARWLTRRAGGIPILAVGLLATAMVRPHVTLIVIGALSVGYVAGREHRGVGQTGLKVVGVAVLLLVTLVVASRVETFLGVERIDLPTIGTVLDGVQVQTGQGGSRFEAMHVEGPLDFPRAAATVLFRPWPFEADNTQALVASIEGLLVLTLCALALRHPAMLASSVVRNSYLIFAAVYLTGFIVAFSSVNNFGILARQRVQLYPYLFALIVGSIKASKPAPVGSAELTATGRNG